MSEISKSLSRVGMESAKSVVGAEGEANCHALGFAAQVAHDEIRGHLNHNCKPKYQYYESA